MGLWHTHGLPNLGQRTRPYNNQQQQKREFGKLSTLLSSNVKVTIIPIVIGAFGTVTKGLLKDWRAWELAEDWRSSKQHYWERSKYWEESWRLEETCCGRPSANADVKKSKGVNKIYIYIYIYGGGLIPKVKKCTNIKKTQGLQRVTLFFANFSVFECECIKPSSWRVHFKWNEKTEKVLNILFSLVAFCFKFLRRN